MGIATLALTFLKKISLQTYAIVGVVLLLGGTIWFINHQANKIDALQTELVGANAAIEASGELLAQMQNDVIFIKRSYSDLARLQEQNAQALEKSTKALANIVSKVKQNPQEGNTELNTLMKERRRCAELASGATPIQGEINGVCPNFTSR